MKERPILFSAPMVRALLDGRKTQTRRVIKDSSGDEPREFDNDGWPFVYDDGSDEWIRAVCPYGQPGDRLWVRETFRAITSGEIKDGYGEVRHGWAYQADSTTRWDERPCIIHDLTGQPATGPMQFRILPWKPSIHMPRRASRILLEITDVRVERVQDISKADCIAEGIEELNDIHAGWHQPFASLWDSINAARGFGWNENPWVWVVTFKRVNL